MKNTMRKMSITAIRNLLALILVATIVLFNLAVFVGCSSAHENDKELSIKESAIIMSNDVMSDKLDGNFIANINKELYDFTGEFNYMFCYDKELDYYAIYNMDSGKIMERSNGNVYDGFLDYKCYYGGFNSYFYQDGNTIYSITDDEKANVDDVIANFKEYSEDLMQASIDNSQFKSRENIKIYVEKVLFKSDIVVNNCNKSNRTNCRYISNCDYFIFELCNSLYVGEHRSTGSKYCKIGNYNRIGFKEFYRYDGTIYCDTLFPINQKGSCGLVAATMILQFYERNELLNTIPSVFYEKAKTELESLKTYSESEVLSEIVHSELISIHGGTSSSFISIKDMLKAYFNAYGMTSISATSSIGYAGLKAAIDNDNPCIITVPKGKSIEIMKNDLQDTDTSYKFKDAGHVMCTYGYTLDKLGILDEFICHTGWEGVELFKSVAYVSKLYIKGNVRLLY